MSDWITTKEATEISGYNTTYLRDLMRTGKVNGDKWMRSWRVSKSSLLSYLKQVQKLGARRGAKPKHST